jgi:hypothetical protein
VPLFCARATEVDTCAVAMAMAPMAQPEPPRESRMMSI